MVARITRLLLLVQTLAAAAIAALAAWLLKGPGLWLPALLGISFVLAARMIITANNFLLAARYRSKLPTHYRIGVLACCSLFLTEFRASMLSSSWSMPFRGFARRVAVDTECLPVLLIHGYGCNSGYWDSMSKALQRARISHYAVDLEPVMAPIDDYVPQVHQAIERLCRKSGSERVILLCHSMGGLVARAYLRAHGGRRLARAITLGTPHHGTALAHFGVGANTHQMRWTASEQEGLASEWLRQLAAEESAATYRLFVSIFSHHDNIISPQTSSWLEGATNIEVHAIGHVALALDPTIQRIVIREIQAACIDAATA
jgi:triacylglycerol lipase